jgi:PTS system nitrogen regulatory IIA component
MSLSTLGVTGSGKWCNSHPMKNRRMSTIADFLEQEDILLDLDVSSKAQLFDEVGRHVEGLHAMPQAWVTSGLTRREQVGSTGLGQGIAIPHARVKDLKRILVVYVRLKLAIPFDAPDGKPVSDILVLLVPKQATEEHLVILADAAQLFSDRHFREQLHLCGNRTDAKQVFETWPQIQG